MKRFFLFLLVIIFSSSIYAQSEMAEDTPEFAPGEFLFTFKEGTVKTFKRLKMSLQEEIAVTDVPSIDKLNKQFKIKSIEPIFPKAYYKSYGFPEIYKAKIPEDADILSIVKRYKEDPNIEHAEPNWIFHECSIIPNDEHFGNQWGLDKIKAPKAWDLHTGSEDVTIAIVDSGIDYNHPDLKENIWINKDEIPGNGIDDDHNGHVDDYLGWDWVNRRDNDPRDERGHGTLVAGIAGAVTNNTIGIAGTSWKCKLMAVRVLDEYGNGREDACIGGIAYAAINGAKIINMSWGSYRKNMPDWYLLYLAMILKIAREKYGCVLVAAVGNKNKDMDRNTPDWWHFPSASPSCIGVAATNTYDLKTSISNYGSHVDVSAPGENIYSTMPTYHVTLNDKLPMNYAHNDVSGTSMAAPFVSGLAALLFSQHPEWTNSEVRSRIESTAYPIDYLNPGYAGKLGKGRINAASALTSKTSFTDGSGNEVASYYIGIDKIFVTTIDHSKIVSLEVKVSDPTTGDKETLILSETAVEGHFRNPVGLTSSLNPTGTPGKEYLVTTYYLKRRSYFGSKSSSFRI